MLLNETSMEKTKRVYEESMIKLSHTFQNLLVPHMEKFAKWLSQVDLAKLGVTIENTVTALGYLAATILLVKGALLGFQAALWTKAKISKIKDWMTARAPGALPGGAHGPARPGGDAADPRVAGHQRFRRREVVAREHDSLGVDGQEGGTGLGCLLQVASDDCATGLTHFGDRVTGHEVDERLPLERLIGLAKTPDG
jgi:hypothetical protein